MRDWKEPAAAKPAQAKDAADLAMTQLKVGPVSAFDQTSASTSASDFSSKLCSCGSEYPIHRGYCADCIKKLKDRFVGRLQRFQALKEEYDNFNAADLGKADEKLRLLRNKLAQYDVTVSDETGGLSDILARHEKLLNSEEGRAHADFRAKVKALESEIKIMKHKQDMELADLRRQQNYFDVQIVKKQGQKRDLLAEIDHLEDRCDELEAK